MPKTTIKVPGWECLRCGHKWIARGQEVPRICPKCKSAYWDTPRKRPRKQASG